MGMYFDPARLAILDPAIHPIPDGAVSLSNRKLSRLVEDMAAGAELAAAPDGKPVLRWPDKSQIRASIIASIRSEAQRRILRIAPIWRQLNDLRTVSPEGTIRFALIDSIRAASEIIEADARDTATSALSDFPVATHPMWPEA